jgi:DNA-binding transcriptional MocR family regulator
MGKASPVGAADTAYPIAEAIAEKVTFVSGASVFANGSGPNTFLLNFSNAIPGHIEAGMRRLGGMLSQRA